MMTAAPLLPRMYLPPSTQARRLVVLNNGGLNSAVLLSLALAHVETPAHITSVMFGVFGPRVQAAHALADAVGAPHTLRGPSLLGMTSRLAYALEYARGTGADAVMYGPDRDDRRDPECRDEYVQAMARVAFLQSERRVRILAPLIGLSKASVVLLGAGLDSYFAIARSCERLLFGGTSCGVCSSCVARREAFAAAHVLDPCTVPAPGVTA